MEIVYKVGNNIYVNLTNRCPYACTFCLRQNMDHYGESSRLWLEKEPSVEEVLKEFEKWNVAEYGEVVFCGFGEPTERFDDLIVIAKTLKEKYGCSIRINTNGVGNLINGRNIIPEMKGCIDAVSISLNHPDAEKYHALVRSKFGDQSFDAMLSFAKECVGVVPKVILTTVETTITKEEEERCAKICQELGVNYRIRPWED